MNYKITGLETDLLFFVDCLIKISNKNSFTQFEREKVSTLLDKVKIVRDNTDLLFSLDCLFKIKDKKTITDDELIKLNEILKKIQIRG